MDHSILTSALKSIMKDMRAKDSSSFKHRPKHGVGGGTGTTDDSVVPDADSEPDYADPAELSEGEPSEGNGPMDQQEPKKEISIMIAEKKRKPMGASRMGHNPLDFLK